MHLLLWREYILEARAHVIKIYYNILNNFETDFIGNNKKTPWKYNYGELQQLKSIQHPVFPSTSDK